VERDRKQIKTLYNSVGKGNRKRDLGGIDILKLGDMVRLVRHEPPEDPFHTFPTEEIDRMGVGLVVSMEELNSYIDIPEKKWVEYTILWSGIKTQLKHLGFDLIKITGEET
jgi:hypothetical protein